MLQVVKVSMAAGGLLQLAQPMQERKSHPSASQKPKDVQGIVKT